MPVSGTDKNQIIRWYRALHCDVWRGLLLMGIALLLAGCGGGSGGTGGDGTGVSGVILRAENNAVVANAVIRIGSAQTASKSDGSFLLSNVNSAITTATVTPPSPGVARTLTLALTPRVVNNLGNIFTSDTGYTASATGTVVAPINGTQQPVGNATVTIAGTQVKTQTTGTFQITNLPIGLGSDANTPVGQITAPDFDIKPIYAQFVFAAGTNNLGTLVLGAPVSNTPPSGPYTIAGKATVGGNPTAGVAVVILNAQGQPLGAATTDVNGNYSFWVVAGNYTIEGSFGNVNRAVTVTLVAVDTPVTAPTLAF